MRTSGNTEMMRTYPRSVNPCHVAMHKLMGEEMGVILGTEEDGIIMVHVEMNHIPKEITKEQLWELFNIVPSQLEKDSTNEEKWRVNGLLPQELTCVMMLINKHNIRENNRIACFPVMMSMPPKDQGGVPFNLSAPDTLDITTNAKKNLDSDLRTKGGVSEVSRLSDADLTLKTDSSLLLTNPMNDFSKGY